MSLYFLFNLSIAELLGVIIMYASFVANWTPGYQFRYLSQFPQLQGTHQTTTASSDNTCATNVAALTFNYLTTTLATLMVTVNRFDWKIIIITTINLLGL